MAIVMPHLMYFLTLMRPHSFYSQCARRDLKCEYPTESRRGMRRRHKNPDTVKPVKTNAKGSRKRATTY